MDIYTDSYLADGNLTVFFGQPSSDFKQDILNSSLLGQLVANPSGVSTDSWFHAYKKILGSIHWLTKSNDSKKPAIKSTSLAQLARSALSGYLSNAELEQLSVIFEALRNQPEDSEVRATLLNRVQVTNITEKRNTTTICPLLTIVRSDKMIISIVINLETTEPIGTDIFEQRLTQQAFIRDPIISSWTSYLREDNYTAIRDTVISKLGNKAKTKIIHLDKPQLQEEQKEE